MTPGDINVGEGIGDYVGRRIYEEHAKKERARLMEYFRKTTCFSEGGPDPNAEIHDGFVCGACYEGLPCDRSGIASLIERLPL